MHIRARFITTALIGLLAYSGWAAADPASVRDTLLQRYPGLSISAVTPTPVAGIYEVFAGGKLIYADAKGDYLFLGPLVETRTRTNLSQARLAELRMVRFDSLPLDQTFTIVRGKGERRVAVFSDPDCPFCEKLEHELAKLDNVTVHVFLYPIESLHPAAVAKARNIWCAPDRARAWLDYMLKRQAPAEVPGCVAPLEEIAALADRLGVAGTPALIFANGKRLDGFAPADRLEALLAAQP